MCKASVSVMLAIFLLVILAMPTYSAVIYVKTDGNDVNDGSSWELAKQTVKAGIDAASVQGGEVWVAAGTYNERINLCPYVYLYGGFAGMESAKTERDWVLNTTILDGSAGGSVVTAIDCLLSSIDGFTIRNGKGAIYCVRSSPTISNNIISGNTAILDTMSSAGGVIYCFVSTPIISNNTITTNSGGGIYCYYSSATISNNVISGNGNKSSVGGGIYCTNSSPAISNNTITNNIAVYGGGIYCYYDSSPIISNNIIAFNSSGIWGGVLGTEGIPVLRNNCVYNPGGFDYVNLKPGTGDISVDPKLADIRYGNAHIQPDSPCIDAGYDSAVQPGWVDMDSQARIQGDHVDIGADESDGTLWPLAEPNIIVRVSTNGDNANDGSSWELAKQTVQAGIDAASVQGGEVWVAAGTYNERINLRPNTYLYGGFAGTETVRDERDWVLNTTILDGNAGGRVVTAEYCNVLCSIDGFTIRNGTASFGGGIYCINSSPTVSNCIITGNNGGGISCLDSAPIISNNTIIGNSGTGIGCSFSSQPTWVTIYYSNSPAIISNNLITNNSSTNYGGGIWCSNHYSATITNNTITGNTAVYNGGGIDCHSSTATISNNTITGNSAPVGGGIWCRGGFMTISNNIISNNNSRRGEGIYCEFSNAMIVSNTIAYNTGASILGALFCDNRDATSMIANNIVAFNSSGLGAYGDVVLRNNCIYNLNYPPNSLPGEGDIFVDPQFRDLAEGDYHLRWSSPCTNAGWNGAPGLPQFDMDGQDRIFKGIVDIGADEYWPGRIKPQIIPKKMKVTETGGKK